MNLLEIYHLSLLKSLLLPNTIFDLPVGLYIISSSSKERKNCIISFQPRPVHVNYDSGSVCGSLPMGEFIYSFKPPH